MFKETNKIKDAWLGDANAEASLTSSRTNQSAGQPRILRSSAANEPNKAGKGHNEKSINGGAQGFIPDDLPIIVHCHLRWDFVWQRPQHIFSRLAKNHRVMFTEDPIWEEGEAHLRVTEPYPNVVRVVPILPPQADMSVDAQCAAILPLLKQALKEHPLLAGQFDSPIQWFYSPMTAPCYMGQFGAVGVVYDCMDELANFRFAPPDIAQREKFVLSKADVVFTGGYQLYQSKSKHHTNVHFYGCGVDVEHFGKARKAETPLPADVADLQGPIYGYYGVIDERIDYDLVAALADGNPDAHVVMVGPLAKVEESHLPKRANIHWVGQRSYDDLPAYIKAFDVCLMPFALNEATQYINPTKTLEYMAGAKPIVSTAVPDVVRNFTPIVDVAKSHEEFAQAVRDAAENPHPDLIARGIERANGATWDATVEAMRGHILQAVERLSELAA